MRLLEYSYLSFEGGPRLVLFVNRWGEDVNVQLGIIDGFLMLTVKARKQKESSILPLSDARVIEWVAAVCDAKYVIVEVRFPTRGSIGVMQKREDVSRFSAVLKELLRGP